MDITINALDSKGKLIKVGVGTLSSNGTINGTLDGDEGSRYLEQANKGLLTAAIVKPTDHHGNMREAIKKIAKAVEDYERVYGKL